MTRQKLAALAVWSIAVLMAGCPEVPTEPTGPGPSLTGTGGVAGMAGIGGMAGVGPVAGIGGGGGVGGTAGLGGTGGLDGVSGTGGAAGMGGTGGTGGTGGASGIGGTSGTGGTGGGAPADMCADLVCFDVFDCALWHPNEVGPCKFTKCDAFVCKP